MNMPFNFTRRIAKRIYNIYQTALFREMTAAFEKDRKKHKHGPWRKSRVL
jgi:ribosome-associated toxin RatA of RatAB toxin-antitoxin module